MLSVVVATYNRVGSLRLLIEALKSQSITPTDFEVIIVDDGSNDGTAEFLAEAALTTKFSLQCAHQINSGPAAARNLAMKSAKGEIIVFTDDDCIPDPDWLERIDGFFQKHPDTDGCGGKIRRQNDSSVSRYIDRCGAMRHPIRKDGTVAYLVTANAAYRRNVVDEVGGFSEDISWPGGEDPDLSFKVVEGGGQLAYCRDAVIRHEHRDSLLGVYKMFFNHGRGGAVNAHWNAGDKRTPRNYFRLYLSVAIESSRSTELSISDKATTLLCGILRAVGFSRGFAFQQRLQSAPVSPAT